MKINGVFALMALVAIATCAHSEEVARQSRDDAWWTGPLLAASAGSLPTGHFLFEPYFFDAVPRGRYDTDGKFRGVSSDNNYGSQSYVIYGVTDRFSVGLIPKFGFDEPGEGRGSAHLDVGDLTLQAQYGLTQFAEGSWIPTTAFVVQETLPTGKYDRLGDRPADGRGGGAYSTTVSIYSQYYFWMPGGRILRTRLDVSYGFSGSARVRDTSVYGTDDGFVGRAYPGDTLLADAAWEYSVTRNWVLALDLEYAHSATTRLRSSQLALELGSGSSYTVSFAPAVEYNWNSRVGVIVGAKITALGRNASAVVIPVAAINIVM